ncbi:MAG TPA: rhomboid family intramembrane serine protease [Jatrophihabitans sp.]|jgi:membrane associated rhomboid family serine protease
MTGPATDTGVAHCYRHPNREAGVRCTRCDRPICPECMRPASVGFHCPDDVAIGRRTQRPLRNSVGAALRDSPPVVTITLLALNVAAYVATGLPSTRGINQPEYSRLFQDWQLLPYAVYHDDEYFRLVTAAFLHANLLHIAVNMISLVFVGPYLERAIGWWRFALVYVLSALGGSAAIYAFGAPLVPVVGASGALFGLLGTCLVLVRRLNLDLQWLVGIIVLNFVLTFSVAGISRLGHIGGFVTGALCGLAIGGWPTLRRRVPDRVQLAGAGAVLVLIVAIIAVRTATGTF